MGIENWRQDMLRHSFSSIAITSGADIASVSQKLGKLNNTKAG